MLMDIAELSYFQQVHMEPSSRARKLSKCCRVRGEWASVCCLTHMENAGGSVRGSQERQYLGPNHAPPKSHLGLSTQDPVTLFGGGAFTDMVKLKGGQ